MKEWRRPLKLAHRTLSQKTSGFFTIGLSNALSLPDLPLLDSLADEAKKGGLPSLDKTAVIGMQHILPTTATLFDVMIRRLGVRPENMFFKGKFYSTHPDTEKYMIERGIQILKTKPPKWPGQYQENTREEVGQMWESFEQKVLNSDIERVIVLDDGGMCLESIPNSIRYGYDLAGIEQTRFGLYSKTVRAQIYPLIDVARSAAKKNLESHLIADSVLRRINNLLNDLSINKNTVFGVVGNGAIGTAITKYLLNKGYRVVIYDESDSAFHGIRNKNCYRMDKLENLFAGSDIVFGCTGKDVTTNIDITELVNKKCVLISCSSQDIEFLTLLKKIGKNPYSETINNNISRIGYMGNSGQELIVLEKGFPINFDRTSGCDLPSDIQLTRGLLFGAFIQAALVARKPADDGITPNKSSHYMLDPFVQRFVVNNWKNSQPSGRYTEEEVSCFNDINWIMQNSSGDYFEKDLFCSMLSELNSDTPSPKRTCGTKC
ncbi:MAG: NAD(P)-dependent oxidoreductase [Gammaproteobacteria bacterium]|nr:NAD(P)-dependent oxidoreductase [Gammaproteobacteria bacterium]